MNDTLSTSPSPITEAFQEGQDAAFLGVAINPYRLALRDPQVSGFVLRTIEHAAKQWEDGYVSTKR